MIIGIIGPPAVGKTTLLNSVTDSLGDGENIEPTFLYRCTRYKDVNFSSLRHTHLAAITELSMPW